MGAAANVLHSGAVESRRRARGEMQQVRRYRELQREAGRNPSPLRPVTPPREVLVRRIVTTETFMTQDLLETRRQKETNIYDIK